MSAILHPPITSLSPVIKKVFLALLLMLVIVSTSFANRTYGPVKANDYLSKIVKKNYPHSTLTKHQIMVAILRSNPEAFRGGNIHFLKQAVTLNLPNEATIASITPTEASSIIAKHLVFFKKGKTGSFTHEPLVSINNKTTTQADLDKKSSDTNTVQVQTTQTKNTSSSTIPTKIKIEVRKQKQTQVNELKHVKSLEEISIQQNKTLNTLDEQIRVLEEVLEKDNAREVERKESKEGSTPSTTPTEETQTTNAIPTDQRQTTDKAPTPLANTAEEPAIEQKGTQEDEEDTAKNAISSLESALSQSSVTPEESNEKTKQATSSKPNQEEPPVQQAIETPKENTKTESSIVKLIKEQSKSKIIALVSAFVIGLFTLGYLLFGRNPQQASAPQQISTDKTFELTDTNSSSTNTNVTLDIPHEAELLNPVIKKQSSSPDSDDSPISSEQREKEAEMKINMARAYMDMGFIDSAKESLEEVLKEGTEEQKDTVKQMLSML